MTTYRCVIFGSPRLDRGDTGRSGRVLRPVHIVASNARGWSMCKRHARNGEHLSYGRFGPLADAMADGFLCMHCRAHAEAMNLQIGQGEVGPMFIEAAPRKTTIAFPLRKIG